MLTAQPTSEDDFTNFTRDTSCQRWKEWKQFALLSLGRHLFNSTLNINMKDTVCAIISTGPAACAMQGAAHSEQDDMHCVTAQLFPSFPPITASPCCAAQTPCQQPPSYRLNYLKTAARKSF